MEKPYCSCKLTCLLPGQDRLFLNSDAYRVHVWCGAAFPWRSTAFHRLSLGVPLTFHCF